MEEQVKEADKEETITVIIERIAEEIREKMCDEYCKYPEIYNGLMDELLEEKCSTCPMCRL